MSFRKGRLRGVVGSNQRLGDLVAARVPRYAALLAIGARAAAMLADVERDDSDATPPLPTTPDKVTDKWLNAEVDRRLATAQREARANVLREVVSTSASEADSLLYKYVDDLFNGLAEQLDEVLRAAAVEVFALDESGIDVTTSDEAIQAGCADQWKTIIDLMPVYADIRAAQRQLVHALGDGFDRIKCGDTGVVIDDEARLYFHRNLDDIAPGWRGGEQLPWSSNPVERLVWCLRHDSGAWVPTTSQIKEHSPGAFPAAAPGTLPNMMGRDIDLTVDRNVYLGAGNPCRISAFSARVQSAAAVSGEDDDD
jgi:hypothetical protein